MAKRILLRSPSESIPHFSRSESLREMSRSGVTPLEAKVSAYWPRPIDVSHWEMEKFLSSGGILFIPDYFYHGFKPPKIPSEILA
jgi:hypothetical protein